MEKKSYKDLHVWQKSIDLIPEVYQLLKSFPKEENYALSDQIRRALVSIPSNIAEGQARLHLKEFIQFLGISKGSLAELHTLLIVSHRLNYISKEELKRLEMPIEEISKMLNSLIRSLEN